MMQQLMGAMRLLGVRVEAHQGLVASENAYGIYLPKLKLVMVDAEVDQAVREMATMHELVHAWFSVTYGGTSEVVSELVAWSIANHVDVYDNDLDGYGLAIGAGDRADALDAIEAFERQFS